MTAQQKATTKKTEYDKAIDVYDQAMKSFHKGDYEKAKEGLTGFAKDYPKERELVDRVNKTLKVARFMDTNRPLLVHGTRKRAVVVMELARKTTFYAEKGDQVIWRVESWPFIWMRDVWHKPRKGLRVWQRLRIPAAEFARMGYVFDPALGGIEVKAGETTTLDYTLPGKLPASLGKTPQE